MQMYKRTCAMPAAPAPTASARVPRPTKAAARAAGQAPARAACARWAHTALTVARLQPE